MSGPSHLKMVRRVLDTIIQQTGYSEEAAREFLDRRYLSRCDSRCVEEVIEHFTLIWDAVCREVADRTALSLSRFAVVVQPSLSDLSLSVVLYNPHGLGGQPPVVLLYDAIDACAFYWPGDQVMEIYLETVVRDWIRRLEKAGVVLPGPRTVPVR